MNIDELNDSQKKAVTSTEGPLMVLAGAGSGKTRTLVKRITYLLNHLQISPFRILALTFSNKAAREMRERVSRETEIDIGALKIQTFHSFCAGVLRSEATYLGLGRNFTIYDEGESKSVVKSLLQKRGISTKEISPYEILGFINDIKNNGYYDGRNSSCSDYTVDQSDDFFIYYQEYEAALHNANATDFGGLITGVIKLFETFPDILKRYQERFKYLLVDEYQDTNRAQFDLVKMICEKHRNICVVGDEDQSIYSWRGADIKNILDFEKYFPETSVIKLEQNYRSSQIIIDAASCVIARNEMRKGKTMWTENPSGDSLEIVECYNDKKESEFISSEIVKLIKKNRCSARDIAVFYRANSQSRIIEDSLRKEQIPYRVIGGVKFYDRKEIKDMLAYLRLVVNDKDSLALCRIINVPTRGIGAVALRKLEQEAIKNNSSLWDIISDIVDHPENYSHIKLSAKVKSSLSHFTTLINEVKVASEEKELPSILYEKMLNESGYLESIKARKDYESMARLENLKEMSSAFKQFETGKQRPTLIEFLETISIDTSSTSDGEDQNEEGINSGDVSLMTVHGSKGLEFPYVFLAGAEENMFPSYLSLDNGPIGIEEERRLFYVAMTRAMKKLYITFAQARMLFGNIKFNGPSRYINEIPPKFYNWKQIKKNDFDDGCFHKKQDQNEYDYSQESYDDEPVVYQIGKTESYSYKSKYSKGTQIIHAIFGEGLVLESEGSGNEEKVVIKFRDGTKKKFMAKFAPLTIF